MILQPPPDATPQDLYAAVAPVIAGGHLPYVEKAIPLLERAAKGFETQCDTSMVVRCRILAAEGYLLLDNEAQMRRLLRSISIVLRDTSPEHAKVRELLRQCDPTRWGRILRDKDLFE
jgi:hypothetical protein